MFLEISFQTTIFLGQKLLFFVNLRQNYLAEISSKFFRAARLIDFNKFFDFISEFSPESFIFGGHLNVLFLKVNELFVDGFKATFELLYFSLISI